MRKTTSWVENEILAAAVLAGISFLTASAKADNPAEATCKAKCAMCHGADGKGETAAGKANKLRDLASPDVQKQGDADLTGIITSGKKENAGLRKERETRADQRSRRLHPQPGEEIMNMRADDTRHVGG